MPPSSDGNADQIIVAAKWPRSIAIPAVAWDAAAPIEEQHLSAVDVQRLTLWTDRSGMEIGMPREVVMHEDLRIDATVDAIG